MIALRDPRRMKFTPVLRKRTTTAEAIDRDGNVSLSRNRRGTCRIIMRRAFGNQSSSRNSCSLLWTI